jgi:DNA-binding MurR/RpiR family transcriptional regulator
MNLRDKLHEQIDKMPPSELELFDVIFEQRRRTLEARVPRNAHEIAEFKRLLEQPTEPRSV